MEIFTYGSGDGGAIYFEDYSIGSDNGNGDGRGSGWGFGYNDGTGFCTYAISDSGNGFGNVDGTGRCY